MKRTEKAELVHLREGEDGDIRLHLRRQGDSGLLIINASRILNLIPHEAIKGATSSLRPSVSVWILSSERMFRRLKSSLHVQYGLRTLLRRPYLTFLTVISISLAFSLAVSWNIFFTSIYRTMKHSFDQSPWSFIVDLAIPMDREAIEEELPLNPIHEYEGYLKAMALLEIDGDKILQLRRVEA